MNEFLVPHGLPEWILVSADGRVRCEAHQSAKRSDGRPLTVPTSEPKISADIGGYLTIHVRIDGRMRTLRVHRLVMLAHAYKEGCEDLDVNHINGVRTDNRRENLEWCTRSENHLHAYRVLGRRNAMRGKRPHNKGRRCYEKSFPIVAISDGGERHQFPSIRDAVIAGFESSSISHCLAGRQRSHRGYKWERAA